ncbi:MAG: EamA family transporter [Anaerolineae bacterium]|nr:MAG: EamA family transporter [Anaerolineae bacterium]
MRIKADLTLFAVAIIWGTAFIAQDIAGQYRLAYLFNAISFLLGALALLPFVPRGQPITREQWKWMIIAGLVLFIAAALQQIGIFYTQVANAGFLTSLYTVFTPFLLWIFFREKPHRLDIVAVIAAISGAWLLSTGGQGLKLQQGDGLIFIGALFWAAHFVILGKFAARYEPISFSIGQFLVCGLLNLTTGLLTEPLTALTALPLLGAIAYRGLMSVGIGYTLQVWGQNHTPPTDAALILSMESVFAALAGWLILSQHLTALQITGCAIIFVAVMLTQLKTTPTHR